MSYIVIQDWMTRELELKSNDLLVYALIYGFSQDGQSEFKGSRSYISDTLNISLPTVDKALKNLIDKELIFKRVVHTLGVDFNRYRVNQNILQGIKNLYTPTKELLHNNIVNNNSNTLSKDNELAQPEFNFGIISEEPKKKTNEDEYLDCDLLIKDFTENKELRRLLLELAGNRMRMASSEKHHFYASTFKHYLDELSKANDKIGAVKLSLQYNNTLKVMEPKVKYTGIKVMPDTNTAIQNKYSSQQERESKMARNSDGTPMTF